jgi:excisionase family DNA binding protein
MLVAYEPTACLAGTGLERPRFQKLRLPVFPGRATRGPVMGITTDTDEIGGARLLITYGEAAAALAVSPRYLRALVYQGVLPSVRLGRVRRIAVADLRSFVDALRDGSSL